jgi:hypothetical protein
MKPSLKVCLSFVLAFGLAGVCNAGDGGPSFDLSFAGPTEVFGGEGEALSYDAVGSMTPGGDLAGSGAQGWSLSCTASPGVIVAITTDGTAAADVSAGGLRNTGFEVSELTDSARAGSDCDGSDGAVSAVVLSFVMNITLSTDEATDIVIVTVECIAPAEATSADSTVSFTDGCQGAGQPVDNRITHQGNTIIPGLGSSTTLCSGARVPVDCPEEGQVCVSFSDGAAQAESDAPTIVRYNDLDVDPTYSVDVETTPGDTASKTLYANIDSNAADTGVQGWSLSASVSGGNLTGATTEGSVAADVSMGGKRNTGFEVTELVDPDMEPTSGPKAGQGPQGQGVVSAVVLSFVMNITLNGTGSATALCITVESSEAQGDDTQTASVVWSNGNQGAGQPVNTVMTIAGNTVTPQACQNATINFGPLLADVYVRCDPNADGKTDIADGVWIVNELFRAGPASSCADSSDCNGDGLRDLSDATYTLAYRFTGGAAPPAPFEECGSVDPDSSGEVGDCVYECD